ncbi:MAG: LytTR family transcriptional regulator [Oscillospiraceae bacterium]|nr:LytTR family transcriptional regulator [Oscillospiraceae bacterium]
MQNKFLAVIHNKKRRDIPFENLLFARVIDKQCHIYLVGGEKLSVFMSMEELEIMLNSPCFVRCHRSNIVNLQHVVEVERDFIMSNGEKVYIRRGDSVKMKKLWENSEFVWKGHI